MTALMMSVAAGCVTSVTRYYVPSEGQGRITVAQLRARADAVLPIECPRLLRGREAAYGEAHLALDADTAGDVQRAHLDQGSGSARLDDILGALSAQLHLAPEAPGETPPRRSRLVVGYSCAPAAAALTVRLDTGRA